MKITQPITDVFVIYDFFEPSEMVDISSFLKSSTFKVQDGIRNSYVDNLPDGISDILQSGMKRLQLLIEQIYGCKLAPENQGTIVKYDIGWTLSPHLDVYDNLPTYGGYPTRDVSSLFYLSGGFDGGDLRFIDSDLTIRPEAGMAVFFPSSEGFMHEVTELKAGDRFTCTSFWHVLEGRFKRDL